ncbi:MAG: hypothetical protein M3O36_18360 [Myxococcota bacterium]|nr:hypothetical protein [Myxococcota bacterium]
MTTEAQPAAQPGVGPGGAWPLPTGFAEHLSLGTPRTTLLYWAGVSLVVAALFVTRLLPCVDYPQHLALGDVARRLWHAGAPEHATYELDYFTYNGLFHLLLAGISAVLPVELAGRLLVAASLVGLAGAVIALVRVLRRPPVHAALFTPVLFSFSLGWGFVNYVLATAIAGWALVFVVRVAVRPTPLAVGAVALLGLTCAFAHVLAMLILCAAASALGLEVAIRAASGRGPRAAHALRVALRAALAVAPLLLGCAWCIAVYHRQYVWNPGMYRDPTMEGSTSPVWEKLALFSAFATDLYTDFTDQILLWASLVLVGWSARLAWKRWRARPTHSTGLTGPPRQDPPPIVALFVVMTLAYLATPMVLIGTHLIFPRIAQWSVLGAILAMPAFPPREKARTDTWMLRLGLLAGANTIAHCAVFGWETVDASRLIDDLPPAAAVTALIWEPETTAFRNGTLTHLAAYYAARKHGRWAFAFARYLSVPVRFKRDAQPAWPAKGWEFSAENYDPRCKYARVFPLVVVKAPPRLSRDVTAEAELRLLIFKQDASAVKLLSHHGRYWAFDSSALPEDGTL